MPVAQDHAPSSGVGTVGRAALTAACLSLAACGVSAQQQQESGTGGSGVQVLPRLGVSQTWTDNNTLQSEARDAALVTVMTPGISVSSRSGRVKGSLDYALSGVLYVKSEQKSRTQQSLSAQGVAELLENSLYVDVGASIGQQVASAFGQQTPDSSLNNPNRTEVANLSISPYFRGAVAGLVSYELRANATQSNARNSIVGDSHSRGGSARIDSLGAGRLGWWTSATTQKSSFKAGNSDSNTSLLSVGLRYRPDVDLQFGANVGRERNDYQGNGTQSGASYGLSSNWTPTPRTRVAADWQYHSYGNGHSLSLEHRLARSSIRFSDAQNVSLSGGAGAIGLRSNYDLLFLMYASLEPDPVKRDLLVRSTLQSLGLSLDSVTSTGFLATSPMLMRNQQLSFSLEGLRTTVTAMLSRSLSRRLGTTTATDDLSLSNRILLRGVSVNIAHRLTPTASASLLLSEQQSRGDLDSQSTTMRSIIANWTGRLGARTSLSLGARYTDFRSSTPYRERAVFANLVQQF